MNIVAGGNSTGLTVTSVTSLFADPACLIVSVNQNASSYPILKSFGHFGVNILPARLQAVVAAVGEVPQRYAKLRCFYLVFWDKRLWRWVQSSANLSLFFFPCYQGK